MGASERVLDFIVIGAQKAGTTSLFHYLRHHPQLALPAGKEAPFFSHDSAYERGWSTYVRNLARELPADQDAPRRWGTVTPHYMVGGVYAPAPGARARGAYDERTVPARIRERLPDVRLIALLRDPVERALSHHRMQLSAGREARSFDEAIAELLADRMLQRARAEPHEETGYVAWGEYGRILGGYFDVFAPQQILVVFTAELERAPLELLGRLLGFIGVNACFAPPNLDTRYRARPELSGFAWRRPSSWISPTSPLSPQALQRALRRSSRARAAWGALGADRQRRLRRPYELVATRAAAASRRAGASGLGAAAAPNAATISRLREHYARDADLLAQLLGAPPPWASAGAGSAERPPASGAGQARG